MAFFELSDNKLKKMQTLKKNYEFENVLKKGKFYVGKQVTVYITNRKELQNRFGIAISKKTCHAVKRNWIKRKIRENYRLIQKELKQGHDIVFLWNKKVLLEEVDYKIIQKDMLKAFQKAGLLG